MIFLTLFCVFATVQGEIHDLHYTYTLSKPISQTGVNQFAVMGTLDDRPIDFYNTEKKPMLQEWIGKYNKNIEIMMDQILMHHNISDPDVHILQWMHGCQVEKKPDGSLKLLKGFDQYAYDGRDFLSFNIQRMEWVLPFLAPPAAESIKKEWEDNPIRAQYTKGRLETYCVNWLDTFVKYQEQELQTFPPPEIHIFAKKSISPEHRTLVCLATGFYPPDVAVDILKNGIALLEWDGVTSSGVRPNGDSKETYQLRKWLEIEASDTSKYSCRIHYRTLLSPMKEFWDGKCSNCDSGSTGVVGIVGGRVGGIVGGIVLLGIVLVVAAVILFDRGRKRIEKEKAAQARITGQNQPLCPGIGNGYETESESGPPSPTGSTWSIDSNCSTTILLSHPVGSKSSVAMLLK